MMPWRDGDFVSKPMPISKHMHRFYAAVLASLLLGALPAHAQTLRGSRSSMVRQNSVAKAHDFTFLRTTNDVSQFVDRGFLVRISGNSNYELAGVSFPYARPQVRTFVQRLASQYRAACGERLVVTSLTRPQSRQPRNASSRSVHPTGMAIDLRVSDRRSCRSWLEGTLLSLERQGVLDATREHRPPHYHIALFPTQYDRYVGQLAIVVEPRPADVQRAAASTAPAAQPVHDTLRYQVRSGDSLWQIARSHGTTVNHLRQINNLSSSRIFPGQVIEVPAR
jgi:LysM repeat protein